MPRMAKDYKMGLDVIGLCFTALTILGGIVVWSITEFRRSAEKKKQLEERFQKIESFIALDSVKESHQSRSIEDLETNLKELNKHIDNLDERLRIAEIDIAVLKPH